MLTRLITDRTCFAPLELSIIAGGTARLTSPELANRRKELMDFFRSLFRRNFSDIPKNKR